MTRHSLPSALSTHTLLFTPSIHIRPFTGLLEALSGKLTAVSAHRTDELPHDPRIAHPMLSVSVVNVKTGQLLLKSQLDRPSVTQHERGDYILPMMTRPFPLQGCRRHSEPVLSPTQCPVRTGRSHLCRTSFHTSCSHLLFAPLFTPLFTPWFAPSVRRLALRLPSWEEQLLLAEDFIYLLHPQV